ncbi:MAG: response regulator [Candidatus Tectomicrobia bacterium]|uniref:histidine kinase n=1 Tax=Tectimicrobiota bacterium TaxID=2528274 RepID=A0A932CPY3_UNCTE|nr:response regulator [Candidatus Tectomicrobia bacterium]
MAQQRANILVVDDELGTRESLRVILEGRYQVKTVERGKEALRLIAAQEPDIIFLDLLMPEMSGIEVLRRIREISPEIQVAIVTAYASLENAQEALRLGATDYLIKPFDRRDVERVVEKGLSRRREHQQVRRSMEAAQQKLLSIEQEKEQLQREFTLTREYLECLLESSPDAIVSTDIQGRITFYSRGAEELYGYRAWEMIGTPLSRLYVQGESEAQKIEALLQERGRIEGYETDIRCRDGRKAPSRLSASLLQDKEGEVIGRMEILQDITESRRLQEQLVQTERLRALGEMAAGVAHDFNNILALISTRAQLLNLKLDPPNVKALKEGLAIIQRAAMDGAETVRRIRELTRARGKKETLRAIDPCQLVRDVVELTRPRWESEAPGPGSPVELVLELAEVPPVAGIQSELREVLTNLIFNALEAMPQGGRLSLSTGPSQRPGEVEIRVQDTGLGVPAEVKGKIFEPLFTTKGSLNSGLGLSVSYGIVARYGGTIEVESQEGQGSTFIVRLRSLDR